MPMRYEQRQKIGRQPIRFKADWKIVYDDEHSGSAYDFYMLFCFGETFCHMASLRFSRPWHDLAWRQGGPGVNWEDRVMGGGRFFFPRLPTWPAPRTLYMMHEMFLDEKIARAHVIRWEVIKQEFDPGAPNPMAGG